MIHIYICLAMIRLSSARFAKDSFTDVCDLRGESGPCQARIIRYYYNPEEDKCKVFLYGGCEGNENNFKDMKECSKTCIGPKRCNDEPTMTGPCRDLVVAYTYRRDANSCRRFAYGGCEKNQEFLHLFS